MQLSWNAPQSCTEIERIIIQSKIVQWENPSFDYVNTKVRTTKHESEHQLDICSSLSFFHCKTQWRYLHHQIEEKDAAKARRNSSELRQDCRILFVFNTIICKVLKQVAWFDI